MSLTHEAIEKLLATGRAQQAVQFPDGGYPFYIKPNGEAEDVSKFFPPNRIKQNVTLIDAKSFCEYVNLFMGNTMIFANVLSDVATFTAVLDYHRNAADGLKPGACQHRATFTTQETPEWKIWKAANRKPMSQLEFATFIEDNLSLFVRPKETNYPVGAELLELVRTLHGHKSASFDSMLRLQNGAYSVNYQEAIEIRGTSEKGSIEFPTGVCGGFALFHGCAPYEVKARLKTKIVDRSLSIWFETEKFPHVIRESLLAVVKEVEAATKIKPMMGAC